MTPAKQLVSDLKAVKRTITNHWVRGAYCETEKRKKCYCLMGGIKKVTLGDADFTFWGQDNEARYLPVLSAVVAALPAKAREHTVPDAAENDHYVIRWNDRARRTEQQVIALLDRAITKAERAAARA